MEFDGSPIYRDSNSWSPSDCDNSTVRLYKFMKFAEALSFGLQILHKQARTSCARPHASKRQPSCSCYTVPPTRYLEALRNLGRYTPKWQHGNAELSDQRPPPALLCSEQSSKDSFWPDGYFTTSQPTPIIDAKWIKIMQNDAKQFKHIQIYSNLIKFK